MPEPSVLLYALLGGILPALLWLWFWLRQDKKQPEPTGLILVSFLAGMAAVLIVLPIEHYAASFSDDLVLLLIAWAAAEEILKYSAIYIVAFKSRYFDERIDAIIYMITVALGFAALENTLFLLGPIADGTISLSVLTGNMRFVGATLLHVLASGVVGLFIAYNFCKGRVTRGFFTIIGLSFAIALHALFNFFIIQNNGEDTFTVFAVLWVLIIAFIFLFERIKYFKRKRRLYS